MTLEHQPEESPELEHAVAIYWAAVDHESEVVNRPSHLMDDTRILEINEARQAVEAARKRVEELSPSNLA